MGSTTMPGGVYVVFYEVYMNKADHILNLLLDNSLCFLLQNKLSLTGD